MALSLRCGGTVRLGLWCGCTRVMKMASDVEDPDVWIEHDVDFRQHSGINNTNIELVHT